MALKCAQRSYASSITRLLPSQSTWNLYSERPHTAAMNDISAHNILPATADRPNETLPKLMLGAVGVVYGDIGTSPLYALKESFLGPHPLTVDRLHIFGVLSLVFWSLMLIVTVKYVAV